MGPGDLGRLLCGLELPRDPNLLVGAGTCDDAGVYRLTDEIALIQTLDFFTPIVDDPYRFGQIAAANALSDVYAMGGRPLLCMNILACPIKTMPEQALRDVIRGGLDKVREAGALLVGGHSIEDAELKFGLSVTGLVHPQRIWANGGAREGDVLVLTKPLGTGILTTALKGGLSTAADEECIARLMATLNRLPAEILREMVEGGTTTVHAATDVTGFGLVGHLHEMAAASARTLRVRVADLPLLAGALDLAEMGIIPAGAHANREYYRPWVECRLPPDSAAEMLAYDPQTSGGLVLSLPPAGAAELLARLQQCDYPWPCAVIGQVSAAGAARVVLE
ncbi:MAG: selenide, water dikinase SelD [Desulfobulbaceae bacterium A2]|nr:MAG: selenide, water dikinase SelD [Desulfobulbaceae bacterium A2]